MGADLAGVTAGGIAGGAAGFGYADLGTNGITLVADLAEQNMAQVRRIRPFLTAPSPCSSCSAQDAAPPHGFVDRPQGRGNCASNSPLWAGFPIRPLRREVF